MVNIKTFSPKKAMDSTITKSTSFQCHLLYTSLKLIILAVSLRLISHWRALNTDEQTGSSFWKLGAFLNDFDSLAFVLDGQYFWLRAIFSASESSSVSASSFLSRAFSSSSALRLRVSEISSPAYFYAMYRKSHPVSHVCGKALWRGYLLPLYLKWQDLLFIESFFHVHHLLSWMHITKYRLD